MALVDHERVLVELKRTLLGKNSWGQRELLATLAGLEAECARDERPSETLFRLYGPELEERFFGREQQEGEQAATASPRGIAGMTEPPNHREADAPKEATWTQERRSCGSSPQSSGIPAPSPAKRQLAAS